MTDRTDPSEPEAVDHEAVEPDGSTVDHETAAEPVDETAAEPDHESADDAGTAAEPVDEGADDAGTAAEPLDEGADDAGTAAEPLDEGADDAGTAAEPVDEGADDAGTAAEPGDGPEEDVLPAFLAEPVAETGTPGAPGPGSEPATEGPTADAPAPETEILPAVAPAPEPTHASDSAPEDETETRHRRFGWLTLAVVLLIVIVVGGYAAAAWLASGRIAAGTTVLGAELGGKDRAAAVAALEPAAAETEAVPVALVAESGEASILPSGSGLAIDVDATVDSLLGFTLNPLEILRTFTGNGSDEPPITTVDDAALASAVDGASAALEVAPVDANVQLSAAGATAVPAIDGAAVDVDATAATIADAWPTTEVEATVAIEPAALGTDDATAFADSLNSTILVGDVTLTGPNGDATVTSSQIRAHGSVVVADGSFALEVDGDALAAALEEGSPDLVNEATAASFRFDSAHDLHTVESQPGREIDGAALGDAVVAAAEAPDRTGELPYRETEAAVNNDTLGVKDFQEKISTFTTPLPYDPTRTRNLVRAGELITGTVVLPGEQFDITEVLAPVNAANGYFAAGVIVNGIHTEGYGGGLSQVATTTYNAGYFAGMKDIAHRPHSVWFQRYPAGRESTMFIGSINMVFENTTPYALVMSAYVDGGTKFTVDVWSTPYYEVRTSASGKSNIVPISTVELDDPECEDYPGGEAGFTITNTRTLLLDGEVVATEPYTWTYRPDNAVRCV